jgi:hypothetical protein
LTSHILFTKSPASSVPLGEVVAVGPLIVLKGAYKDVASRGAGLGTVTVVVRAPLEVFGVPEGKGK